MTFDGDGIPTSDMREIERRILGADHQAFGAGLCEAWKFPKSFTYVTRHHHEPKDLPIANRMLTAIIHIADCIASEAGYGFRADLQSIDIDPEILGDLGINQEQLEIVKTNLPQAFEEIEATFG